MFSTCTTFLEELTKIRSTYKILKIAKLNLEFIL